MTIVIDDKLLAFFGAAIILCIIGMFIYVWVHDLYVMYKHNKPKEHKPFYSNIQKVGDYNVLVTKGVMGTAGENKIPTTHFYDAHFWVKDGVVAKNHVKEFDNYPVGTKLTEEEITSIIKDKIWIT